MKSGNRIIQSIIGTVLLFFVGSIAYTQTTYLNNASNVKSGIEYEAKQVYIPNSFTPNGDGLNDEFKIYSDDIKSYSLKIFNEDGEEMYSTIHMSEGWDGTKRNVELKQGVYLYRIDVTFMDQTDKVYLGHLNLIR